MSDPFFSSVSLLLHCDGTNGSTTFTDSSNFNNTMTPAGNAAISTASPKFGTGSYSAGAGFNNGISTPAITGGPFDLSVGDFTIEKFFNSPSADTNTQIMTCIGTHGVDGFETILVNPSAQISAHIYIGGIDFPIVHATAVTKDVYHHLAFVRFGTQFQLYLDGIGAAGPQTSSGSFGVPSSALFIGYKPGFGSASMDIMDEIRITKGVARYTGNFTPPTAPFDGGASAGPPVYGKFLTSGQAFPPIQSANLGNTKPRFWQPHENLTVKVPK